MLELRLDAVLLGTDGKISIRQGQPRAAAPAIPNVGAGERHLGNIYLSGFIPRLGPDHLFPVLERAYPERRLKGKIRRNYVRVARRLSEGQPLRILAWGDSVTDGRLSQGQVTTMAGAVCVASAAVVSPGPELNS